ALFIWSLLTTSTLFCGYGDFPEEELLLSKLSPRSYELRENDAIKASALIGKISRQFKAYVDSTQHDFSVNLCKNRMRIIPIEPLNANDVSVDTGQSYILFALPKTVDDASLLFEAALQKHTVLFVSLLESTEAREKFNNFWQQE